MLAKSRGNSTSRRNSFCDAMMSQVFLVAVDPDNPLVYYYAT